MARFSPFEQSLWFATAAPAAATQPLDATTRAAALPQNTTIHDGRGDAALSLIPERICHRPRYALR